MTFTQKLVSIIGILVAVATAIAFFGLQGASSLNNEITNLTQKEAKKLVLFGNIDSRFRTQGKEEKKILLADSIEELEKIRQEIKERREKINKEIEEVKPLMITENIVKLERFYSIVEEWTDMLDNELMPLSKKSMSGGAEGEAAQKESERISNTKGRELGKAAMDIIDELNAINVKNLQAIDERTNSDYETLRNTNLAIAIGGIGLAILVAFFMVRQMMSLITVSVNNVNEGAEQVASASNQISSSSQQLAEGAQEQAASVEEITSSLTEIKATTEQNTENAREADMLAKSSNSSAQMGYEHIKELNKTMEGISDSSRRISNIIKTIDEIAFQTNLLALNAAVEAARAGEHGLGFAVVAEEVRNLAQRSAEAAKDTANIIETSIEEVKKGNQIAEQTNRAFEDILDKVKKTGDIVGEIAISSKEQSRGINQLTEAMGQVDSITQIMASNSEESAAASEEMSAQAVGMKTQIVELGGIFGITSSSSSVKTSKKVIHHELKNIKKSGSKPVMMAKSNVKKASEVIPLDESDLKEF